MPHGNQSSIRENAVKAAAAAAGSSGCPTCTKAGLPILLTRPGLADRSYAQEHKSAIEPLLNGITQPQLQHLGYVMRTLRKGYVHAYYEQWHTPEIMAQQGWQVFEVHPGGYLSPHPIASPTLTRDSGLSCNRTTGYAGGHDVRHTRR